MKYRKTLSIIFIITALFFVNTAYLFSQELLSAKDLLTNISETFKSNIKDFKADIQWTQDNKTQKGTILFKNPQKLRIDITDPDKQVICTNGYELWVYISFLNLVLHQDILSKKKETDEEGEIQIIDNPILINPVGFDKFVNDYSIEFSETKEKVKYKDNAMVYKFKLIRWRSTKSGFNVIYLTVQENGLIREIKGITAAYRTIILDLDNYETNTNISDLKFNYEPPAHTSSIDDFITDN